MHPRFDCWVGNIASADIGQLTLDVLNFSQFLQFYNRIILRIANRVEWMCCPALLNVVSIVVVGILNFQNACKICFQSCGSMRLVSLLCHMYIISITFNVIEPRCHSNSYQFCSGIVCRTLSN